MFIADTTRVLRSTMGGSGLTVLVQDAVYRATGLTLDLITKRVYWCDNLL
jgi:low density lipoprotein-related protein 2